MPVKKLTAEVYNLQGKVVGQTTLPKEVFAAKINSPLMAQAVRVYLANQRQGTASTKTRGEVRGSTRKIYRQKHTGRARHGAIRAPIFVGGGIVFGPRPRDFSLKLPQKMKRRALFSALTLKFKEKAIKVVQGLEKTPPKTKTMAATLGKLINATQKQKILIVIPDSRFAGAGEIQRAVRNIEGVNITPAATLNTYQILENQALLLMKEAIGAIEKNFLGGK